MANYILIQRLQLTQQASSVTFNNLPSSGYTDLKIVTSTRLTGATTFNVTKVTFNSDTTASNYAFQQLYGVGSGAAGAGSGAQPYSDYSQGTSYTANTFTNSEVYVPNYFGSALKNYTNDAVTENNATAAIASFFATKWNNTAAITSITFTPDGSYSYAANSTFSIYGIAAVGTTPTTPKAIGGDIVKTDGTYWYHAFLSSGTFTPTQTLSCDYLVVAGGGSGGSAYEGGGGGAGGLRSTVGATGGGGSLESPLSLLAQGYTVTIGAGGSAVTPERNGNPGTNSVFATVTSLGGGYGACGGNNQAGGNGGSGGGTARSLGGGTGTSGQGFGGGNGGGDVAGGGGGAGAAGSVGGAGGAGVSISALATATGTGVSNYYAGGGGGGNSGAGGAGGGGAGNPTQATAGTVNSGGAGGGARTYSPGASGAGGSGIVIVRYAV